MSEYALASIDVGREMSEQENLKKYMLLGIENITSLKECIKCEILIILLSLPCIVFNIFEKISITIFKFVAEIGYGCPLLYLEYWGCQ